jgi:hypothetical protein
MISAIPVVEDKDVFNWPVNGVVAIPTHAQLSQNRIEVSINLTTYSPYFASFEWSTDGSDWITTETGNLVARLEAGSRQLEFRVVTASGDLGPTTTIEVVVSVPSSH